MDHVLIECPEYKSERLNFETEVKRTIGVCADRVSKDRMSKDRGSNGQSVELTMRRKDNMLYRQCVERTKCVHVCVHIYVYIYI